jgi:hypothetical protein
MATHKGKELQPRLEALQEVLKGAKATFLFGKGDLIEQVRSLTARDEQADKKN